MHIPGIFIYLDKRKKMYSSNIFKFELFLGLFCTCKDFINDGGFGNCFKKSGHSKHGGKAVCYVEQPSTCSDLIDSKANPGEKVSAEACQLKGKKQRQMIRFSIEIYFNIHSL